MSPFFGNFAVPVMAWPGCWSGWRIVDRGAGQPVAHDRKVAPHRHADRLTCAAFAKCGALTQVVTTLTRPRHLLLSVAGLLPPAPPCLPVDHSCRLDGLAARTGLDDVAAAWPVNQPSEAAAGMSDAESTLIGNLPGVARSTGGLR